MSNYQPVSLEKSYRLLNHGPTVLVTSAHNNVINVMAAAWNMPLDYFPPKVAVVIDKNTLTRSLVEQSGQFVLNIPSINLAELTVAVGSESGHDVDKFQLHNIATFPGIKTKIPLIRECFGWLECKVISEPHIQATYDLFLGEVIAAWADPKSFEDGHWKINQGGKKSLHYIAGGHFFETGTSFSVNTKIIPD